MSGIASSLRGDHAQPVLAEVLRLDAERLASWRTTLSDGTGRLP
jgi:hypothetical protein